VPTIATVTKSWPRSCHASVTSARSIWMRSSRLICPPCRSFSHWRSRPSKKIRRDPPGQGPHVARSDRGLHGPERLRSIGSQRGGVERGVHLADVREPSIEIQIGGGRLGDRRVLHGLGLCSPDHPGAPA